MNLELKNATFERDLAQQQVMDLEAENDRLKVTNAALLEALEAVLGFTDTSAVRWIWRESGETAAHNKAVNQARAAIAKAREPS